MQIGQAISYGNTGDRITVQIGNRTVQAIAANEINSTKVLVLQAGLEYYVWSETPPLKVLEKSEGVQIRPEEIIEPEEVILPFQVLSMPNVQLGGDRGQNLLVETENIVLGGINNLGNQQYLAVWLEQLSDNNYQLTVDNNGSQQIANVPELPYFWIGAGILAAVVPPVIPEEDRIVETQGQVLPPDFSVPLYPVFFERSYQDREGVKTTEQEEEKYSYLQIETYNYRNIKGGTANTPTPSIFDLNAVCNFTTSGAFETQTYSRTTELIYNKTISETLEKPPIVWFNNQVYKGERIETYNETYDYNAPTALFNSSTSFRCTLIGGDPIFGFYQWQEVTPTNANWSGETTTINRTYEKIISEPEWQRPITLNYSRLQQHNYNKSYSEQINYSVPSESWSVPVGSFFLFEVPGTETQTITCTTTESKTTITPLLLSGDGNSALFTTTQLILNEQFQSDRIRDIPKFLYNNSTEFPNTTASTEATIVETYDLETAQDSYLQEKERIVFSLYNNQAVTEIDLKDSWVFKIKTTREITTKTISLSNDNGNPILKSKLTQAIAYRKEEDKVAQTIEYFDFENNLVPIPWWDTIKFRSVYVLQKDKRYRGIVLSYRYEDEEDEILPIETMRSLSSITLELEEIELELVETYPVGLVAENEILIIPQDNCSVLLKDILLSEENKKYCNLVGNILYFAKSVESDLTAAQQQTEIYFIGQTVTQEASESGGFVPITEDGEVLGISYFNS